jgi:predicted GNAT family acetyltransferase
VEVHVVTVHHTDVASFTERASPLLLAHEAHNNLLLGLCGELRQNLRIYGDEPPVLRTVEDAGRVALAAVQTPPHRLLLSHCHDARAVATLAEDLHAEGRALPGALGPRPVAEAFAQHWGQRTGQRVVPGTDQRIYQLTRLRPPAPAPGHMRRATEADRALLAVWFEAFQREALGEASPSGVGKAVARWLSSPSRTLALWDDGGPVAMAGAAGPTPGGIRIGAVYTPPERRRRGYASALVAALSQAQLDAGRRFCFLFTDLANPTSNHIYQAIGYEPVVDIAELLFAPAE